MQLRQNASRYLEEVAAGESIEITDRGHPVARLVPITGDPWEDLISAGEVVKAARRFRCGRSNPPLTRTAARRPLINCGAMNASQMRIYLDTSALIKLVVAEEESQSLQSFISEQPEHSLFTAVLARTELIRAVAPNGAQAIADAETSLAAWTPSC